MRVIEEEYVRQMKKCVILREMQDPSTHGHFDARRIPPRIQQKTLPYFGTVKVSDGPKFKFENNLKELKKYHWSTDPDLVNMSMIFTKKCIDFLQQRFLNTNKT